MKLLTAILLMMNIAWAQTDCAPMNLVTEENSPFQKIPVFDQDGLNICYAYTASQLIDYELIKKGKQDRSIHPVWGALKYAELRDRPAINMGNALDVIRAVKKYGNCPIESINGSLSEWTKKANANEIEVLGLIEKLVTVLPGTSEDNVDQAIKNVISQHAPYCSGNPTWDQLVPELKALSTMTSRDLISNLVLNDCQKGTQKISFSKPRFVLPKTDEEISPTLNKSMDEFKSPISISYCAKALYDPTYDGLERTERSSGLKADCSPHDSLIVGKKKIEGQCHYLLRNTWGSGFHRSNKDRKCLCKNRKTGEYIDDCIESTHNNGDNIVEGCWVNEEIFSKNSFGITHLTDALPVSDR